MRFFNKPPFKEPWNISLSFRIQKLKGSSTKKKVVYIYDQPDSSTFRYRVYNMCQALEGSTEWEGIYFFANELEILTQHLSAISFLIFCRTKWTLLLEHFMERSRTYSIPLVFDIDDLIFDLDYIPLVMNTLSISFTEDHTANWFSHSARIGKIAKHCDRTIGTNEILSNHLEKTFNTPSSILPNFLNREQLQISKEIFIAKERQLKAPNFTLGYFSGSPSHANDFAKIAPEICDLLYHFPNISLEVVGFMDFPPFLRPFVQQKRIQHRSLVDFLTLQKEISLKDVNLIPLVENAFTQCKSELKFFEAAIVGTLTLASPTHVYTKNIDHGKTGYLCEEGDWYEKVKDLYQNSIDPKIIQNANSYCLNKYSPESMLPFIEAVLNFK